MGSKPSKAMQQDRPESGGADRKDTREDSGVLDRDKEKFAKSQAAKREKMNDESDHPTGRADKHNSE